MVGTAVFRIVVSSDSMKNATAMSHGRSFLLESASGDCDGGGSIAPSGLTFVGDSCIGLHREKPIISDPGGDFAVVIGRLRSRVVSFGARRSAFRLPGKREWQL